MKNLIAMAVTVVALYPLTSGAENSPSMVGEVTLRGNFVQKQPMWQWTVNDYQGPLLNVMTEDAMTDENNDVIYKLPGETFIAVSGYLPSLSSITPSQSEVGFGVADYTYLTDSDDRPPANWDSNIGSGAVSFTIRAYGGNGVYGYLKIKATELRGVRVVTTDDNNKVNLMLMKLITGEKSNSSERSHCFTGGGTYNTNETIIKGSALNPLPGNQSPTAWNAFIAAFNRADAIGNAPKLNSFTTADGGAVGVSEVSCSSPTVSMEPGSGSNSPIGLQYLSAAHILELTPVELRFDNSETVVSWSATLNVTAYQM